MKRCVRGGGGSCPAPQIRGRFPCRRGNDVLVAEGFIDNPVPEISIPMCTDPSTLGVLLPVTEAILSSTPSQLSVVSGGIQTSTGGTFRIGAEAFVDIDPNGAIPLSRLRLVFVPSSGGGGVVVTETFFTPVESISAPAAGRAVFANIADVRGQPGRYELRACTTNETGAEIDEYAQVTLSVLKTG